MKNIYVPFSTQMNIRKRIDRSDRLKEKVTDINEKMASEMDYMWLPSDKTNPENVIDHFDQLH